MNLIIDGNAFINVAVSIVKNILKNDRRVGEQYYVSDLLDDDHFMLKQISKDTFGRFTVNYMGSIFAPFKDKISSVFFVFDSKSWRHKYVSDHFDKHGDGDFEYKGQRKHDEKMYLFFEYFQNEILNVLSEEYGIVVNRVRDAEGDDLIAYICENLREDICIWTVDKDLTQLVENSNRKVMVIMPKQTTKYKKIYTAEGFDTKPTEPTAPKPIDLLNFSFDSVDNSTVTNIVNDLVQKDYKHFEVDPTNDILTKLLSGDVSDHIPRCHPKMTPMKVEKVVETIRTEFFNENIMELIDTGHSGIVNRLGELTNETLKIKDPDEQKTILHNIERNKTIIRLHTSMFPKEILSAIQKNVDISIRRPFSYNKFKKNYKH